MSVGTSRSVLMQRVPKWCRGGTRCWYRSRGYQCDADTGADAEKYWMQGYRAGYSGTSLGCSDAVLDARVQHWDGGVLELAHLAMYHQLGEVAGDGHWYSNWCSDALDVVRVCRRW